ncbi:MAG TPA: hypothetical protein VG458_10145 [Solirubrobacterales bacterium]|nr:hypothetical protein [Solirubrobacterales bacterium]
MAVMAREAWTDERLDDLKAAMDTGFAEMRAEFRALRAEMNAQHAAQQRMMVQLFGGMLATTLLGFLGVIATIITQG